MTTDQRLDTLEELVRKADQNIALLTAQGIRMERFMERFVEEHRREHEEYRRDAQQYRRLWTHLAQKHGWLDDEDWPQP